MSKRRSRSGRSGSGGNSRKTSGPKGSGDYEVGYGRPPKSGQFQPGHAPHPRGGRPKGAKDTATKLNAVLSRKIAVTEGGKRRMIDAEEAILHRYLERALNGDVKAGGFLLAWKNRLLPQEIGDATDDDLSGRDEEIIRNFVSRLGPLKKEPDTDDSERE